MNRKLFFAVISVMLLAMFAFGSGCGSSTSSLSGSSTTPDTPSTQSDPAVTGVFVGAEATFGTDIDNDNKPDVLDFDGVQQLYATESGTVLSGEVPFMVWMSSLPEQNSPDIISAQLTAGTTYTFEVSKNFADPLGGTIPDVKIYDPSGDVVDPELTTYPEEQPSMILFTFTPSATGTYTAEICNANENPDPDIETEVDTKSVLFVYKEMHGPSGENGYYTRFVITDNNGSALADLTVPEIIQLRKNFINAHPYYLDEVYGPDKDNGTRTRNNENGEDITENLDGNTTGEGEEDYGGYNSYMANLRSNAGIIDGDEEADAEAAGFSSAADQGVTQIESVIYGVPYEDAYQLGTGFMATTNLQALSETALEEFKLEAPKSTDKIGTTKFTYSFISSKEDYEQKMGNNFSLGLTKAARL